MDTLRQLYNESKLTQAQAYRIAQKLSEDSKSTTIVLYDNDIKNYVVFRKDDYESLIGSGKIDKTEYQSIKEFEAPPEEPEETPSEEPEEEVTDLEDELGDEETPENNEEVTDLEKELGGEPTPENNEEEIDMGEGNNEEEIDMGEGNNEEEIDLGLGGE